MILIGRGLDLRAVGKRVAEAKVDERSGSEARERNRRKRKSGLKVKDGPCAVLKVWK